MPARRLKRGRKELSTDGDANSVSESGHSDQEKHKKVRWVETTEASDAEDEASRSEEETTGDKVCLAAWCTHGRVGCAYYDPVRFILHVMEDTEESPHFDLIKILMEQANPDIVLTSSNADDDFMDFLGEYMDEAGGFFQIRPHKDFVPSRGRDRLLSLSLLADLRQDHIPQPSSGTLRDPRDAYDSIRKRQESGGDPAMKRWNASIRISNFASAETSPLCMASIGALLDHLVRERAVSSLEDEGIHSLDVRDIEIVSLNRVMQINADALLSLQIFENESHASLHSDKMKEGLSLFGTLNGTKTTLGRSLLRHWLLRPSLSLDVINARHDAVACFSHSENIVPGRVMHTHLKGIRNVPRILGLMRAGKVKLSDWHSLVKFTFHAAMIRETLTELHGAAELEIVKKLASSLDIPSLGDVGRKVNEVIDWEESAEVARVCVRQHVDEELDNRKHVYHGIDTVLSKVAEQISQKAPYHCATSLNVVYFPQLGFLICVPMADEWQSEAGVPVVDGWNFQFSSNAHVYFKSQEMQDMDTHIGDLHSLIVDREIEIIQGLLEQILMYADDIGRACDVCAELDCLLSFAEASNMYDYRRPRMVEDNIIDICRGRHPLQEQVVDAFVPNDAHIVGGVGQKSSSHCNGDTGSNSVLLCTGANACGKSVYLKQIALIQYMAQIGCFVPAESATLGVVDKIFTRISTRESVSRVQSAFMNDLNQVSLALRNSTSRSLILLDEFGKGTLATGSSLVYEWTLLDGAGLFCGIVKHLLARCSDCPKVLIATHFHDVFREDLLNPDAYSISFCHMQVMFTSSDGSALEAGNNSTTDYDESRTGDCATKRPLASEKITYLYRVMKGLTLESHAARCAALLGLPSRLVRRAEYVSQLITMHETCRLLDEDMSEQEQQDLADAEDVCRRFLAWDLDAVGGGDNAKENLARCLGREDYVDERS